MKALIYLLFCLFVLAAPAPGYAQQNYTEALQQGQAAARKGDYEIALKKYRAAQAFDPDKRTEVDKEIDLAFAGMRRQRDEAVEAKKRAEKAEQVARDLVKQVEAEKRKALDEKEKAQALSERHRLCWIRYIFMMTASGWRMTKIAAAMVLLIKILCQKFLLNI